MTDTAGTAVAAATLGTFTAAVPAADVTPPTAAPAAAVSPVTTAGNGSVAVSVTYADGTAVQLSTIGPPDLTVSGPAGALAVTAVTTTAATSATPLTATYAVAPPAGGFTAAADGTYAVVLVAGAVSDLAGNAAAADTLGTFAVDIGTPSAVLTPPPPVTVAGMGATPVTVTYADVARAVLGTLIDPADLTVAGPAGVPQLAVT